MREPLLVLRADGGPGIGSGHLARCHALGEGWVDRGGAAVLVTDAAPSPWPERAERAGISLVAVREAPTDADWWAIDGYVLGPVDTGGSRVLRIDDFDTAGTGGHGADLVLDQNLGAARYPGAGSTLVGPRFALLRRAVLEARVDGAGSGVLLTLGGAPDPVTTAFGDAVARTLEAGGVPVVRLSGVDEAAPALASCAVALTAAGSTCWELAHLGRPMLVVPVAENQERLAAGLVAAGAARRIDRDVEGAVASVRALLGDRDGRSRLAAAGSALVDGRGVGRLVARLRAAMLRLRPATAADAALVHGWSNDPATRAASFSTDPIPWDAHVRWFTARLADPLRATYIAADGAGPVGMVRFDRTDPRDASELEIGVTVAPGRRGGWLGAPLVVAGCSRAGDELGASRVVARVKDANAASRRVFEWADFDPAGSDGPGVLRYVLVMDRDDPRA